MKRLMEKYDDYALSVSQRPNLPVKKTAENISSAHGMNLKLIEEDALLEYPVRENYYGTPRSYVENSQANET